MSVETVGAAIVDIAGDNKETLGIASARNPAPATLDSALLPCLFVWTGAASYVELGDDLVEETRLYRIQVAVMPEGEATPDVREARIRPLLTAARDLYFSYPGLNQTEGVQSATPLGDSGIVQLPEYGRKYLGFELRLQVKEYIERTYADYE